MRDGKININVNYAFKNFPVLGTKSTSNVSITKRLFPNDKFIGYYTSLVRNRIVLFN